MKKENPEIRDIFLGPSFYREHKEGLEKSDFGLDNSSELIEGGFGLYSTADLKKSLGPFKTQFFRIALIRAGAANVNIGIETYHPVPDSVVLGFPGQIFSLYDKSDDFFAYYLLFAEEFLPEVWRLKDNKAPYPFHTHTGVQSFTLSPEEAGEVEALILKINGELKNRRAELVRIIQLYVQIILVHIHRSYERQLLYAQETATTGNALFRRFMKLVGRHFLTHRKVSDYAGLLHISSDYLNRTIKSQSAKTASELIDEMILTEAKAYLLQTELSNAEIAYRLEFSDPSHFNKFFKKHANCTPLQYRTRY